MAATDRTESWSERGSITLHRLSQTVVGNPSWKQRGKQLFANLSPKLFSQQNKKPRIYIIVLNDCFLSLPTEEMIAEIVLTESCWDLTSNILQGDCYAGSHFSRCPKGSEAQLFISTNPCREKANRNYPLYCSYWFLLLLSVMIIIVVLIIQQTNGFLWRNVKTHYSIAWNVLQSCICGHLTEHDRTSTDQFSSQIHFSWATTASPTLIPRKQVCTCRSVLTWKTGLLLVVWTNQWCHSFLKLEWLRLVYSNIDIVLNVLVSGKWNENKLFSCIYVMLHHCSTQMLPNFRM